jgi:hypothetical protein
MDGEYRRRALSCDARNAEALLRSADMALLEAKESGRSTYRSRPQMKNARSAVRQAASCVPWKEKSFACITSRG